MLFTRRCHHVSRRTSLESCLNTSSNAAEFALFCQNLRKASFASDLVHLIVVVIEGPFEEDDDARPKVFHHRTKLGQAGDCSCSDSRILQDDPVVDVSDVLGRLLCSRALLPQKMQYLGGQIRELTVLHPASSSAAVDFVRNFLDFHLLGNTTLSK